VRDLLIAGMGDSVASGEGDPDRPVALADDGFCFRNFFATGRREYFGPGRVGFNGDKACEERALGRYQHVGARHRQQHGGMVEALRALALRRLSPVALQLSIARGARPRDREPAHRRDLPAARLHGRHDRGRAVRRQPAREINCGGGAACPSSVPGQITQLQDILRARGAPSPAGPSTSCSSQSGANDTYFSGLVAT